MLRVEGRVGIDGRLEGVLVVEGGSVGWSGRRSGEMSDGVPVLKLLVRERLEGSIVVGGRVG